MKIADGSLRIRSPRLASHYIGSSRLLIKTVSSIPALSLSGVAIVIILLVARMTSSTSAG
jgi:hypothetical protein